MAFIHTQVQVLDAAVQITGSPALAMENQDAKSVDLKYHEII